MFIAAARTRRQFLIRWILLWILIPYTAFSATKPSEYCTPIIWGNSRGTSCSFYNVADESGLLRQLNYQFFFTATLIISIGRRNTKLFSQVATVILLGVVTIMSSIIRTISMETVQQPQAITLLEHMKKTTTIHFPNAHRLLLQTYLHTETIWTKSVSFIFNIKS